MRYLFLRENVLFMVNIRFHLPKPHWTPYDVYTKYFFNGSKRTDYCGRDPFNQTDSDRSNREKWSTSKNGPVFSKLFRLDRTDPLSFGPEFPEILVEWIGPRD